MDDKNVSEVIQRLTTTTAETKRVIDDLFFENFVLDSICKILAGKLGCSDSVIAEARKQVMQEMAADALERG
jgi:FixJ family two-component response regulator